MRRLPSAAPIHLQAATLDASGAPLTGRTVTWTSSNQSVATVDDSGVVTGVATGADTITATSEGQSGIAGIVVTSAVAGSIVVAPTSVTVTTGQTSQLTATVKDAGGSVISGAPVAWTVDKPSVAIVGSTGLVSGQSAGTATVTATSGSVHVDVPVTVTLPPANAVVVSPGTVALLVTQRQQLTGTVTDASGNAIPNQTITWASSNDAVAAVGTTGLVIANAPGTATITATSGSVHGTADVTVSLVPVRRVTVTPDALSFTQGDQGTQLVVALLDSIGGALSPTGRPAVTWSSNNTGVASVSGTGFVTPGSPGQAVITAALSGTGLSATATVTVSQVPVASVSVTPSPDTLIVGQQLQLTATPLDASGHALSGRAVTWDDGGGPVATVSSNGRVTALAAGTMTVSATSEGKTGTATIVVNAVPVASVVLSPTTQSVIVGQTTPAFTAVTKDASGNVLNGRTVTFNSSDPTVATINASGVATGVKPGTTSITATSEGKTSNAATLTVTDVPVASVTIAPTTQTVTVGQTTPAFTAQAKDASGNVLTGRTITFSSSAPAVATINATSGVATGVSAGTSQITATSEGKTSDPATLTVNPAPVGSVVVSPPNQTITDGSTATYTAAVQDAQGHALTGRTVELGHERSLRRDDRQLRSCDVRRSRHRHDHRHERGEVRHRVTANRSRARRVGGSHSSGRSDLSRIDRATLRSDSGDEWTWARARRRLELERQHHRRRRQEGAGDRRGARNRDDHRHDTGEERLFAGDRPPLILALTRSANRKADRGSDSWTGGLEPHRGNEMRNLCAPPRGRGEAASGGYGSPRALDAWIAASRAPSTQMPPPTATPVQRFFRSVPAWYGCPNGSVNMIGDGLERPHAARDHATQHDDAEYRLVRVELPATGQNAAHQRLRRTAIERANACRHLPAIGGIGAKLEIVLEVGDRLRRVSFGLVHERALVVHIGP